MSAERDALKRKYGALFDTIAAALFEADPMGINFESNTDEYELEAGTILSRLPGARTAEDVEAIVHQELCRWFDSAGPREKYEAVSATIWEAWRVFSERPD